MTEHFKNVMFSTRHPTCMDSTQNGR